MTRWYWPLLTFVWIEAWLSLPFLPRYLALPGHFGPPYVWTKTWAIVWLPALASAIIFALDIPERLFAIREHLRLMNLLVIFFIGFQGFYILHHLAYAHPLLLILRWMAALIALIALTLNFASTRENAPPAMEILASAALILAFIARPLFADFISFGVFSATVITTRRKNRAAPP